MAESWSRQDHRSRGGTVVAGKLLLISYFFPPTVGGGVFRPLAMVKYLSRLGWKITVITATTPKHYPEDPELVGQIPSDVEVIRIPVVWEGSPMRRLLGRIGLEWIPRSFVTPDERIFWVDRATVRAKSMLTGSDFDCLYTTGPPFSVLLGGLWLMRDKKIDLPWLAEFRDPWTLAPYLSIPNAHHRRVANEAEMEIAERADAIVMVTPAFARMMKEKYTDALDKIHCVPNGFDSDDFTNLPERSKNQEFTIVASGTVFGRYNMNDFLIALEKIKATEPSVYSGLRVFFQGLPDAQLNHRLLENDMIDRCRSRGFVRHSENIRDLHNANLLVLPLASVSKSEGHIPSRAYEYLASGTPILSICPDGDLADLLSGFPQVTRVMPGDTDGVINAIRRSMDRWKNNAAPPEPPSDKLATLTRKARAKEMDSILKKITGNGGGG